MQPLTRNVPFEKFRTFEFINEQHERNFDRLLIKWDMALSSKEYAAALYIFALPLIFEKFETTFEKFESPVSWIVDYEYKYNDNTGKRYELTQAERDEIVINYDLTSSMVHLGRLALHLWNRYEEFHLLDCLSALDGNHYLAFTQAILIRK